MLSQKIGKLQVSFAKKLDLHSGMMILSTMLDTRTDDPLKQSFSFVGSQSNWAMQGYARSTEVFSPTVW